jgi:hypothetical protein
MIFSVIGVTMQIEIQWAEPIPLRSISDRDISRVRKQLKNEPGIYVFARHWGSGLEALYVGQAQNISRRVTQQLNNHRLLQHIQNSKTGTKMLLTGYLSYHGYTNIEKALNTAERAYIRYCISHGHSLHNKLGTRVRTDEVTSLGGRKRSGFPKKIEVESKS